MKMFSLLFSHTKDKIPGTLFCIFLFFTYNMSWKSFYISFQKQFSLPFFFFYVCIVFHSLYLVQFIQPLSYSHLGYFQFFITHDATLNNLICVCWFIFVVVYLLEDSWKWNCCIKGRCSYCLSDIAKSAPRPQRLYSFALLSALSENANLPGGCISHADCEAFYKDV